MKDHLQNTLDTDVFNRRYPNSNIEEDDDSNNSAIKLYGRRFYKDQTSVEYLAEMLLVFVSHKGLELIEPEDSVTSFSFSIQVSETAKYWPEDMVTLKLFTFYPTSKLDTRHPIHQASYIDALNSIKNNIIASEEDKDETVRLLQSLFTGFVGVSKNRTWVTQNFLPASTSLISRELMWKHTEALKKKHIVDWADATEFFAHDRHNFMARGGELLFLQLSHLFSEDNKVLKRLLHDNPHSYSHLKGHDLAQLQKSIELNLKKVLSQSIGQINELSKFVDNSLTSLKLKRKNASLGWVPKASEKEAFLFATEIDNILNSALSGLEQLELLQLLCSVHVLRSLCFQAQRVDSSNININGFAGNYAWIVSDINSIRGNGVRKLAQSSFNSIESLLYRALRIVNDATKGDDKFRQSDPHGFGIFRKISKEIGFVVPKTGDGQRFVMPPLFLRLMVCSLIKPGERVTLTGFYQRVYSHFGIALGPIELASALKWGDIGEEVEDFSILADSRWIEESLKRGGFLEELSDAVSIVVNPGNKDIT
jgi:hypothetical protein